MPTLKWELKDPDSCEGCEYLKVVKEILDCRIHKMHTCKPMENEFARSTIKRPQACKDELGD